jgi:acetyl esterase
MSASEKYGIHSDFAKFPVVSVRFSPLVIAVLNFVIRVTRVLRKRSPDVTVTRHKIAGQGGHRIGVRVVTPDNVKPGAPALIYYHGGAFAMTFASLHLESVERYARDAGCIVVFVCYRLAMKNPFPDGFDDAYASLNWVVENADQLGVDRARIAVGGDSAGGTLAAGVAQKCRDEKLVSLRGQMLIYPALDHRCDTTSATEFVDVPLWNAISNRRMWAMYLRRFTLAAPPAYAAPGLGDVNGLPPSYIETAEFDPLRDEARNYAKVLAASGNTLTINETRGTIHGYDSVASNETVVASMQKRIDFLKSVFA